MTMDYSIFCFGSHLLPVDCRKSRSSLFSIFKRSISYLYSAMLGSRLSPFLGRPFGFGRIPAASFFCLRLYRVKKSRISLYVKPSSSPIFLRVIPWLRSSRISFSCSWIWLYFLDITKPPVVPFYSTTGGLLFSLSIFSGAVHASCTLFFLVEKEVE